jgi:predicted nucleic acid-binding protein
MLNSALAVGTAVAVPAGALAQAWRGSSRQHQLHLLLGADDVDVVPLDLVQALAIGELMARAGTSDVIDGSVALTAIDRRHAVVTTDPDDLARLDPGLQLIQV